MKKIALASLLLAAVAVIGFAEDAAKPAPALVLNGYLNIGLDADLSSSNASTYVFAHDEDYGGYGPVFKLVGTYDADTWGYKFRLRNRGGFEESNSIGTYINYVYGWFTPVSGVTVYAGKLGDGTISALDPEGDSASFYLDGAQVIYTVGGLSVGAAVGRSDGSPTGIKTSNDSNVDAHTDTLLDTGNEKGFLGAYMIQYSLPKTFTVEAHLTTGYDAWNTSMGSLYPTNKIGGYTVSASLDAVPNLTLNAGYNAYQVSITAPTYTLIDGAVFYTVDKYTFGGKVFSHKSAGLSDDWVRINPSVAYALSDALTLGANVDIYTADGYDDAFWGDVTMADKKTAIPAVTATYALGGSTTTASLGYDVGNKALKSYIDFLFKF